jgi:hypothetical protein
VSDELLTDLHDAEEYFAALPPELRAVFESEYAAASAQYLVNE